MSDIKDWADDADLNGEASPAGWPEGMPPSDVNNSAREMMAALRRSYVRQPWYAPGGEIIRVSGTRITIKDDAKVTNYSQFYSVNQRVRVEGEEYNVMGSVSSISYEEPTTTIELEMDAELQLPGTIKEVYVGLSPSDVQGVAGPNLLGCIIGFTEEASQIGAGLLHANGQKFSPSLYPDLAKLYFMGNNSDGTPNYRYGREKVGNEWWPKRPDVRGYFPRFLDDRAAPGEGEEDTRVDADSPRTVGSVQGDAIRNLTGRATTGAEFMATGQLQEGIFTVESADNYYRNRSADYGRAAVIKADASKQVPTASENRPKNIAVVGVIVAYGGVIAGGLADVSELVDMTTEVKNQTLAVFQKINGVDIVNVRGTVTTYDELPSSADIGDLYKESSTGTYYMWSEQGSWDNLAGRLQNYATGSKSLAISTDGSTRATGERAVVIGSDIHNASDNNVLIGNRIDYKGVMPNDIVQYAMIQSVAIGDQIQIGRRSVAVGSTAKARFADTAVGPSASAKGAYSAAIGFGATTSENAQGAIQLGYGTNSVPHTFNVGLIRVEDRNGDGVAEQYEYNYQLLNAEGKIPAERIPTLSAYATKEDAMSNRAEIADLKTSKQDKLTAGANIIIKGNVISATGGSGGGGSGGGGSDDYYRSLNETQKTRLLLDGTYEGSTIDDGEVFAEYDGKFVEFDKTLNKGGFWKKDSATGLPSGRTCVVKSSDGKFYATYHNTNSSSLYVSEDGLNWTVKSLSASVKVSNLVATNGFLYGYNTGGGAAPVRINVETGAVEQLAGGVGIVYSISYGNGSYVVTGSNGVYASTDGINFTQTLSTAYSNIIFDGSRFISVYSNGNIHTSSDGFTWEVVGSFSNWAFGLEYVLGFYVILSETSAYRSTNLTDWSSSSHGQRYTGYTGLHKAGNTLLIDSAEATKLISTDGGVSWSDITVDTTSTRSYPTCVVGDSFWVLGYDARHVYLSEPFYEYSLAPLSYNKAEVDAAIAGNEAVKITGNQNIAGIKNFTTTNGLKAITSGSNNIVMKNTAVDAAESSRTTTHANLFTINDKNDKVGGLFGTRFNTSGTNQSFLQARNYATGSQIAGEIGVYVDKNGSVSTSAPTPASATDNSYQIATTAWCTNASKNGNLFGAPNYAGVITAANEYDAPSNGYYSFCVPNANTDNKWYYIYVNDALVGVCNGYGTTGGHMVALKKGDRISIRRNDETTVVTVNWALFFPCL